MPKPFVATAMDLNWWAEAADGLREESDVLIVASGGKLSLRRATEPELPDEEKLVIVKQAAGSNNGPARRKPSIAYSVDGGSVQMVPLIEGMSCDALFVTPSAAAKFVFPYYEAHRLLTPEEMARVKQYFQEGGNTVVGIAHYPPSRPIRIEESGDLVGLAGESHEVAYFVRATGEGPKLTSLAAFAASRR